MRKIKFIKFIQVKVFLLFLAFFLVSGIKAQQFGGNAAGTQWQQIQSDTVRVIFPKGADSLAREVYRTTTALAQQPFNGLGSKVKKVNIVLQNKTVVANGYVGLGPFRSEFYTTPPSDNFGQGTVPWVQQLAVHEYRHVQQYNNFNKGISKVMGSLFGEQGYDLAVSAAIPNWFFEGDAVYAETKLSKKGRGVMPGFLKAYPALWKDGKAYSWMKMRNGSYKDYVPNHYHLGYLLVKYGYEKYGSNFWQQVANDASRYKGVVYPFQQAVKKYTGSSFQQFRNNALNDFKEMYEADSLLQSAGDLLVKKPATVTSYIQPYPIGKDSILYLKKSYKKLPAFYVKNAAGEDLIRLRKLSVDEDFGYNNGKVVYASYEKDARWGWQTYSVLNVLDIATKKQQQITTKTKYFSPDITANHQLIVANKTMEDGSSALAIIDAHNGKELQQIQIPGVTYYSYPKFLNNDKVITATRNADASMSLIELDILTGRHSILLEQTNRIIGHLSIKDNNVFFTTTHQLQEVVAKYNLEDKSLSVLDSKEHLAAYYPTENDGSVVFTSFTADGLLLSKRNTEKNDWQTIEKNDTIFSSQEKIILPSSSAENKETEKYPALKKPFNFHSWRPNYTDPEFTYTLYGNNVLNTTETQLYYSYNENDKTHSAGGSWVYGGLYPFLSISTNYTFNRAFTIDSSQVFLNQWDNQLGVSIPLSKVKNSGFTNFNAATYFTNRTLLEKEQVGTDFAKNYWYITHQLRYGWQQQTPVMRIIPKWGWNISGNYRYTVNNRKVQQLLTQANFSIPGFAATHGVAFNNTMQLNSDNNNFFSNRLPYARGFGTANATTSYTNALNYHLPLFYPDWGFANIFYLSRVRAVAFYDHTYLETKDRYHLHSTGATIFFDTHWWNQHQVSLGFTTGYLLSNVSSSKRLFFEVVLPVSLFP